MDSSKKRRTRRGPYKRYLKDPSLAIPKTTRWRASCSFQKSVCKDPHLPEVNSTLTLDTSDQVSNDPFVEPDFDSDSEDQLAPELDSSDDSTSADSLDSESDGSMDHDTTEDITVCHDDADLVSTDYSATGHSNHADLESAEKTPDKMFQPIYENSNITQCGAYCAIMEFKRACRLPFTTIEKLLKLLQLLCPPNNTLPRTKYELTKFFRKIPSKIEKKNFCSDCDSQYQDGQNHCDNESCSKKEPSTLIVLDVVKSMKRVITKNWMSFDEGTCGIMFNTDGISPFKSANVTIWPIIISLSKLPPNIRWNKANLIISSFWVGDKKPPMSILFSPFLKLLHMLSTVGIKLVTPIGEKNIKFKPMFGSFDLVAKAPILNMHQFNGKHGCPSCLHPGERVCSSLYYPPGAQHNLRTNKSVIKDANKAESKKEVINGVKGTSVLSGVVDLVNGIPIDYMHCVLEGVTKWLLEKWIHSVNHKCAFYVGRSVKSIDSLLINQSPPHDFSRAPRSIAKHRKHWKASEFRTWLLYYSLPLLMSTTPALYLHHYSLFVCSIHILLKSKISEVQISAAEKMLKDFYSMLPDLYGNVSCTLNAHSLIHLTMYVRLWGPLWTHSLFGYESFNGHLVSMLHSKYKVVEQLCFSIDVCDTIGSLADELVEFESEETIDFFSSITSFPTKRKNMTPIFPGVYSISSIKSSNFTEEETSAISNVTGISTEQIRTFDKLYYKETILHSSDIDLGKRNSSICSYAYNGKRSYGVIQKFCFSPPLVLIKPFQATGSSILKRAGNPGHELLRKYAQTDLISSFIIEVHNTPLSVCAVPLSDLISKCVKVTLSEYSYIIHIPNNFEHH